jgi:protein involved in polysaccharide export with SLBB domain
MNLKNVLLALTAFALAGGSASAQIQAGKSIKISISNVPDQDKTTINNIYPVSDSGTINMPFIGMVRAAGLRNEQLAAALQSQYKNAGIYTSPTIQVIGTAETGEVNQETVTVGGQVTRPGPVLYRKELTLWQAVQSAGGPTPFGSMKRVTVFRDGKSRTYDLSKSENMRIPLQRNDTIDVPQKGPLGN